MADVSGPDGDDDATADAAVCADVDVAIVGGGAAGLSAALEARRLGNSVVLLEASDRLGGRIEDLRVPYNEDGCGASFVTVAAGAEFVHGAVANPLVEALEAAGVALEERAWPNYYYLGHEARLVKADAYEHRQGLEEANDDDDDDAALARDLATLAEAFGALSDDKGAVSSDETLLQYFVRRGVASRVIGVAEASYANDYGAMLSELGAREVAAEQAAWAHGEEYLVPLRATLSRGVDELARRLSRRSSTDGETIRTRARVVDVSQPGEVRLADGRVVRAKATVVAVAAGALHAVRGLEAKAALVEDSTGSLLPFVANALKVWAVLRRSDLALPADLWDVVCADCVFPEIWLASSPDADDGLAVVVGFVTGARADRLARRPERDVRRLFLAQLDAAFGTPGVPHPASTACLGFALRDWKSDAFARGAYTYPSPGALETRRRLAEPLCVADDDSGGTAAPRVFIAGEAVNDALNPCVQGAMASGTHAARAAHRALQHSSHETMAAR